MTAVSEDSSRLLPPTFLRPVFLLLAGILPQILLLLLNLRMHWIVGGELDEKGRLAHAVMFGGQGVLLAALLAAWSMCRARRRTVGPGVAAGLFLLHAAFLWVVCAHAAALIPASVAFWMVNAGQVVFAHFALVAPLLFYTLIRLAGWGAGRVSTAADIAASAGALVGIPVFWMIVTQVFARLHWYRFENGLFLGLFFGSTPVMMLAFLRLLLWAYAAFGQRLALLIVSSLLLPLGGLALNISIPFPCDLQDWRVYALTVLNAAALCLPFSVARRGGVLSWMARAAMYPFSLYFFLLFLPFLPFAIPAMIAAGGGFLILAPAALFVMHSRRLWEEGCALADRWGGRRTLAAFAGLSLLIPAIYTAGALIQRHALNAAMTAVFAPDYAEARSALNRPAAKIALRNLRRTKEGFYLPFISEHYSRLVFNGMTLPDHKIEAMERLLFDGEPKKKKATGFWRDDFFSFFTGANVSRGGRTDRIPPSSEVDAAPAVNVTRDGALVRAAVTVVMTNRAKAQAECVRELTVPQGAVVSGFWLSVSGQRVPGRIFDRKTAAWMYHMIRDQQRRDPGLLQYKDSNRLELRVFPFAPGEVRECGFEIIWPAGWMPRISLGGTALPLQESPPAEPAVVLAATPRSSSVLIPPGCARGLPATRRKPYFHFLVDVSSSAVESYPLYADRIAGMLRRSRGVEQARVDLVNHETVSLGAQLIAAGNVPDLVAGARPRRFEGGFWPERAVRHALAEWKDSAGFAERVPVFVLVTGRDGSRIPPEVIGPFAAWAPDSTNVYGLQDGIQWEGCDVVMLACGDRRQALPSDEGGWAVFDAPGGVRALTPGGSPAQWVNAIELAEESVYARAADGWALARRMACVPREEETLRRPVLNISRDSGILLPSTAYIVVENSAQWRFLEQKEKQAMGAKAALEFDEFKEKKSVPERGATLVLLGIALVALFLLRRFRS